MNALNDIFEPIALYNTNYFYVFAFIFFCLFFAFYIFFKKTDTKDANYYINLIGTLDFVKDNNAIDKFLYYAKKLSVTEEQIEVLEYITEQLAEQRYAEKAQILSEKKQKNIIKLLQLLRKYYA